MERSKLTETEQILKYLNDDECLTTSDDSESEKDEVDEVEFQIDSDDTDADPSFYPAKKTLQDDFSSDEELPPPPPHEEKENCTGLL
ncbi:hypothetical protein J6590_039654 [Homalodisca vitripennis]|nr:hypothetical protein J6590_039654 [Homalodisca vitripennis]